MRFALAILCYHRLVEGRELKASWPYLERGTAVRLETLRAHLRAIARFADVVSEQHALDVLAGRRPLRRHAVWLTFDDGYRDVLAAASLEANGTVFFSTGVAERSLPADNWYDVLVMAGRTRGSVDLGLGPFNFDLCNRDGRARLVHGPERRAYLRAPAILQAETLRSLAEQLDADVRPSRHYLSPEELRQLLAAGWTLGSHGVTHTPFDVMACENVAREANESLKWLSAAGAQVSTIALPDGSLPRDPLDLRSCGYQCVLGLGKEPARQGAAVQPRFIVPDDPLWVSTVLQPMLEAGCP